MSVEIIIDKSYDGVSPKSFLKKKVDLPFFKVQKLLKDKRITLNGKKIKEDSVLRCGDVLKIWPQDVNLREVKRNHKDMKDLGLEVLFDTQDFVVFNKLSGVVVQGAQDHTTSLSLHLAYYKDKIGDNSDFEYFHVHRLDKETSGTLVVAKNLIALRELNRIFRTRKVVKKYLCLCTGEFSQKEGEIDVFMKRNPEGVREKMSVCLIESKDSKKSLSFYRVVDEFELDDEILSLVEVEIKTGITHQIRVHMKHLGHPILSDSMYGNSFINKKFENRLNRQFLHASFIGFEYEDKKFEFNAPFTKDLSSFLDKV